MLTVSMRKLSKGYSEVLGRFTRTAGKESSSKSLMNKSNHSNAKQQIVSRAAMPCMLFKRKCRQPECQTWVLKPAVVKVWSRADGQQKYALAHINSNSTVNMTHLCDVCG